MRGRALDVRSPEETRDAVAAWLVGRTGLAVEEREDGTLVAFAPNGADAVLAELHAAFGGGVSAAPRTLPDIAWQERWREGLGPRLIGRLTVTPSWTAAAGGGARTVVIDPESAFGTGEHASTRTALVLLDRHLLAGDRVLDVGSGSGILAIAAAKLGAARATGIDLDEEAEPVAQANAARNGVAHRVRFVAGFAEALAPLLGPVELVLSNILRTTNVALLTALRVALEPGGIAVFAGMEVFERELFLPALAAANLVALDDTVDDGWWAVAARRG